MKIIPHNSTMVQEALRKAKKLGELNNSITKGHGNAAGYLGEESVASYLNADVVTNRNHDLVLNNKTIEVKTKRRTVKPQDSYEVSISNFFIIKIFNWSSYYYKLVFQIFCFGRVIIKKVIIVIFTISF